MLDTFKKTFKVARCFSQWAEHITAEAFHRKWGDVEPITLMKCQPEWLGHVARMSDSRILSRWLPQPHPSCVPKEILKISVITWYDEEQCRGKWFEERC